MRRGIHRPFVAQVLEARGEAGHDALGGPAVAERIARSGHPPVLLRVVQQLPGGGSRASRTAGLRCSGSTTSTSPRSASRRSSAAYQALLTAFDGRSWWAGVCWWMWDDWPDTGETARKLAYTPHGKPAEKVLRRWWRG